jgi:hypothetical protein
MREECFNGIYGEGPAAGDLTRPRPNFFVFWWMAFYATVTLFEMTFWKAKKVRKGQTLE